LIISTTKTYGRIAIASAVAVALSASAVAAHDANGWRHKKPPPSKPLLLKERGTFAFGGTVITAENGDTFHGDHGVADYQIPMNPRKYSLVMWHGGGQYSRTFQTTPDGRDGFDNIFTRLGYATYVIDQPRRGRAGRSTVGITLPDATPSESNVWNVFRLGKWVPPEPRTFFPGVQFPRDEDSLNQYFRQQTSNTGPEERDDTTRNLMSNAVSELFDKICLPSGPAGQSELIA
jgi:hypothetical protein